MLRAIARSDFSAVNGSEPERLADIGWVWASEIMPTPEKKGVFTSLLNAGLVRHNGLKGDDGQCALTDAGFAAYKAL